MILPYVLPPLRMKGLGHVVVQLAEALRCKAEGRGFDSR
jgi:hypothetical protein